MLAEDAGVSVAEMSKALGVSAVTLRNDLSSLAEKGFVVRTHGGAIPAFRPNILERQKQMVEAKTRIARAAAEMVDDGDTVMICAGTTTAWMPKFLLGKSDVRVVTNSTLVLPYARINPALHVTFCRRRVPAGRRGDGRSQHAGRTGAVPRADRISGDRRLFPSRRASRPNSVETATAAREDGPAGPAHDFCWPTRRSTGRAGGLPISWP